MAALKKQQSWNDFQDWCERRGLCPAPAHPWTVAAYARTLEGTMRLDAIRRHVGRIGQVHYEKIRKRPDRHPVVQRTLESMRRRTEADKQPPPPPLFRDEDFTDAKPAPRTRKPKTAAPEKRGLRATPKLVRRKRV